MTGALRTTILGLAVSALLVAGAQAQTIPMKCFPPPLGTLGDPPCAVPPGLDPKFVSPNPSGAAVMTVNGDDTASFDITLQGLAPNLVITAWISYFFPPGPAPDPIFLTTAAVSAPLAPTTAGFTGGLGPEPNQFFTAPDPDDPGTDVATLSVALDYNPLKASQGPLRNNLTNTNQVAATPGSGAEQSPCCVTAVPPSPIQPVGSSYLRVFGLDGFQELAPDGRAKLRRSPVPVAFLAIVVHIDETTHGINPGVPIVPRPAARATDGDHFLLGLFDLRPFQANM